MAVLDDPGQYYASSQADWALGDIVVVPVSALWKQGERPTQEYPQPAPPADGSASVIYTLWRGMPQLPDPLFECWLTPAMIVVDDCVIDKEFNSFVERRIGAGISVTEAENEARANTSLDPLVTVAPVLPYGALRFMNEHAVRQGSALGYFPVVESDGMDEGYVDFVRTVPVSRQLLWGPVAALSDPARRILRWKLAQFYGFRNLSVDTEIMAAIGKTITDVRVITDTKNRLIVDLELDHGTGQLQLRQEPRRTEIPTGHQRGRPDTQR